jgi:hypothetical protein
VVIEVSQYVQERKGVLGFLKKPTRRLENLTFVIHEPTLSILDRISAEQIELSIDEAIMRSEDGVCEAKKLSNEHSRRMAKIIAIAVIGQNYVIAEKKRGVIKYRYDNKRLDELTEIFFHNVKPSLLFEYVMLISTISNLGDFTNSIRLMSAARTTMPILVEENKKG